MRNHFLWCPDDLPRLWDRIEQILGPGIIADPSRNLRRTESIYTRLKRNAYSIFVLFWGVISNISAISFIYCCSPIFRQLMHSEIALDCHKCFNMKRGHHPHADTLYSVDAHNNKRNTHSKLSRFVYLFSVLFPSIKPSTVYVCVRMWPYIILKHLCDILI